MNTSVERRHFSPCDLLPIPQVPPNGPRTKKPNRRLGSARNLTSDCELQKLKEANEEKIRKENKKEEAALKKAAKGKENSKPLPKKVR
jgi:hypothetical protein